MDVNLECVRVSGEHYATQDQQKKMNQRHVLKKT